MFLSIQSPFALNVGFRPLSNKVMSSHDASAPLKAGE